MANYFQLGLKNKRVLFSFIFCLLPTVAWGGEIPEYKLKAAYLYNFASFTEWPEKQSSFQVCIFGEDPFGKHLKQITARKIQKQIVSVRTVKTVGALEGCQMIFIAPSASSRINQVLSQIEDKPVLTIADTPGALDRGAMINMATRRGKVTFDVNLHRVKAHGLKISSKLLRLAKRVVR